MECNSCPKACKYNNNDKCPCNDCEREEKIDSRICDECIKGLCKFKPKKL